MAELISFSVTANYASFKDPSVTSNQLVYYIPSKTAIVGILGAMIGIKRDNKLGDLYSKEYLDFFSQIKVGLQLCNNPQKITYYTNHRSFKAPKTKPVKKELLESPKYRFFVEAPKDILDPIKSSIANNNFVFTPYLGHAYCMAQISDLKTHNAKAVTHINNMNTDSVILDESDSNYNTTFDINIDTDDDMTILVVERHLHHFFEGDSFTSRVLKFWIPLQAESITIDELQENKLSKFYEFNGKVYCLY